MDIQNITQPSSFIFFILIIVVGYILVEVIWWENYWFKKSLMRYNGNIFDRLIHYVSIGILFHVILFLFVAYTGSVDLINGAITSSYNFSQGIHFTDGKEHFDTLLNIQVILASVIYFIQSIILLGFFYVGTWLWEFLELLLSKVTKIIKSNNKKTKKVTIKSDNTDV